MALVCSNEGAKVIMDVSLFTVAKETVILKLYTNAGPPAKADTAGTYTEVSGFGYSAITLTAANWTNTAGVGNNPVTCAQPQQTFTFTSGPVTVNGYYVVGTTTAKLYWAEAFSASANIPAGGGTIKITPSFQLN